MTMRKSRFSVRIPPLVLIGAFVVLFPIFTYMTIDRINRQRNQSIRLLIEKGTALIRAFEAGSYTGMMHMGWNTAAMENLLRETGALPDIAYIFIVKRNGRILIHSQKRQAGWIYGSDINLGEIIGSDDIHWRIKKSHGKGKVFEVFKKFSPVTRDRSQNFHETDSMHHHMQGHWMTPPEVYDNTVIFAGMNMQSIEQAYANDIRHTVVMGVILALIGFTGFILIFIVQRYTSARSSLSRIKIFSDTLVESMPVGMIATDTDHHVISVNPAARAILNMPEPKGGKDLYPLLPEALGQLLRDINHEKRVAEKEIRLDSIKDDPVILDAIAAPLYDRSGEFLGSLLLIRDKTELDRLKTEMETNKRFAVIGRVAAGVAHEIRNPLSSLKGYAAFFKEIFDKTSENYEIADMMTREADRLNRVVSEMGELAKPISISESPVNIRSLVKESIRLIGYETDVNNVKIKTDFAPDVPEIYADGDKLRQVLINLYLNAVQSMEGAGTLGIKLFSDPFKKMVTIEVSDTGIGIPEEKLADIFEPYFTTKQSGTGLGLAIVHNIIRAHRGEIHVKSDPHKGTVFRLILPVEGGRLKNE